MIRIHRNESMIITLISSISVIIIVYLTVCFYVFSCNFSSTVNITNKLQNLEDINKNCFIGTGEWDGTKCNCKNVNVITNNDFNGHVIRL